MNRGWLRDGLLLVCLLSLAGCGGGSVPFVAPARQAALEANRKGLDYEARGDQKRALAAFAEAQRLSASIEYSDGSVVSLINLARLQRRSGDLAAAQTSIERAALLAGPGTPRFAEVAFEGALLALAQQRLELAENLARQAAGAESGGGRGRCLNLLARVQLQRGNLSGAAASAGEAQELNRAAGDRGEQANALRLLAEIALRGGDTAAARTRFGEALALDQEAGLSSRIAADLRGLARCAAAAGQVTEEAVYLRRAFEVSLNGGDRVAAAADLERLAALYRSAGETERAAALEGERAILLQGAAGFSP